MSAGCLSALSLVTLSMPRERYFSFLVLLIELGLSLGARETPLSCLGEDGLPVPWYAWPLDIYPADQVIAHSEIAHLLGPLFL